MSLHEKHIAMIEAVNNSKTEHEHREADLKLEGWRDGVEAAGKRLDLCAADWHYMEQGIERPMCCGVFLDWKPL